MRAGILRELFRGPKSMADLANAFSREPSSLGSNLMKLRAAGLVKTAQVKTGGHRAAECFEINSSFRSVSFPWHWYQVFSEGFLEILKARMGDKELREIIYETGRHMGRSLIFPFVEGH